MDIPGVLRRYSLLVSETWSDGIYLTAWPLPSVLAPLLVVAGWTFALSTSAQLAAYTVLLLVLLVWVAAIGVVGLRRAA